LDRSFAIILLINGQMIVADKTSAIGEIGQIDQQVLVG
jgi:hypothetical protein